MISFIRFLFPRLCWHPFSDLHITKASTVKPVSADYEHITYYVSCLCCRKDLTMVAAQSIGGFEASYERQMQRLMAKRTR